MSTGAFLGDRETRACAIEEASAIVATGAIFHEAFGENAGRWGLPTNLAALLGTLAEFRNARRDGEAAAFVAGAMEAIPSGADVRSVVDKFMAWVLSPASDGFGIMPADVDGAGYLIRRATNLVMQYHAAGRPAADEWRGLRSAAAKHFMRSRSLSPDESRSPGEAAAFAVASLADYYRSACTDAGDLESFLVHASDVRNLLAPGREAFEDEFEDVLARKLAEIIRDLNGGSTT
ncbi:MAG: hypothetical protein ABS79_01190 [Planctomycetes bacterium SCN 63-9]|nr:MAG: hypothetical protein ABS79_01190 [Planctomycetes bacterium SCN 63-9]